MPNMTTEPTSQHATTPQHAMSHDYNSSTNTHNNLLLSPDFHVTHGAITPDVLSRVLSDKSFPAMMDEWLNQEISQLLDPEGLFKASQDVLPFMPHSPPLTPSPPMSRMSGSPPAMTPLVSPPATAFVPLFPEIPPQSTTTTAKPAARRYAPVAPRPMSQPVPIMPKSPLNIAPLGGVEKRKLDTRDQDEIALKRQKNTDAARRSRLKKVVKMETLQSKVTELEGDNARLTTRIAVLESEKGGLEAKEKSLEERVRILEAQLAEAHKALTLRNGP